MKHVLFFLSACIITLMQSCSSDQEPMYLDPTSQESEISHMVVKFDGRTYETDVKTVGDSVVYLNEEYAEVYRTKIVDNSEIATMISSDEAGTIYVVYYDSEEDLRKHNNMISIVCESGEMRSEIASTRGVNFAPTNAIIATAELYRNTGFGGKCITGTANTSVSTAIPNLGDMGFNDKASSIKLFNKMDPNLYYTIKYTDVLDNNTIKQDIFKGSAMLPVLICYRNVGYEGKALYCVGNPAGSATDHMDSNLKKLGFNDIISSFEFVIINRNAFNEGVFEGYITPHN